ncbi:hypothetical protein DM02DRAFT_705245 [Periconia macrospinosa]|uniref:Uncharacterized protein n=1 Tax=Periconia macrospinosa TaxID=97972 RepID=A0A2V1DVQ6_9PLEO|nr:hypothetical protein DM02DRAFT_705245 [Periconia macrospinosa]
MRFFSVVSVAACLASSVVALPTQDNAVVARSADPEAVAEALSQSAELSARGLTLVNGGNPSKAVNCPMTPAYAAQAYTAGQIKAAYLAGAQLNADGKQIGANNYPHPYRSNQQLPNGCGTSTQEFVIMRGNTIYDGGSVATEPDRVLYEVKADKKQVKVKYCAVIRHVAVGFDQCD